MLIVRLAEEREVLERTMGVELLRESADGRLEEKLLLVPSAGPWHGMIIIPHNNNNSIIVVRGPIPLIDSNDPFPASFVMKCDEAAFFLSPTRNISAFPFAEWRRNEFAKQRKCHFGRRKKGKAPREAAPRV